MTSTEVMETTERPRLNMSAVEIQQEYFEAIGDADWELYKKSDRKYLLQKIAVALCGPPSHEGNLMENAEEDNRLKLQGYETRDEETCMKVFNKIMEQAKYSHNGENLIISILRVVCVIPSKEVPLLKITPKDYWVDLHTKKGDSVHNLVFHVFSIRKCISLKDSGKCCKFFIDHDARVYDTWISYLTENKLPKCVMVVPEDDKYAGVICEPGEMPQVKLSVLPSPELGLGARVLNAADTTSTVASVGALVTAVGSVFAAPAVAPVLVGTAVGVGVATGIYGIGRSISNLVDRAQHEQSISIKNSEARSSWINIMVSSVGISFATAGKLLTWAATSGRNVKILMSALDFLKYTNLATGFIGVANGLGDMIYKYAKYGDRPTKLELFQFTTSALFLGIGAMSNQTAQEIVNDAQANKINEIRDSLSSNNKRKIFDKVTAETRRVKGNIEGNTDIIRALNNIKDKDDFFGKLKGINKSVNKNKVRISLSPDGKVLINNQHKVNLGKVNRIGNSGRDKLFAKYGPAKVTTKNAPTRIYSSTSVVGPSNVSSREIACYIRPEEIIKITNLILNLSKVDQEFIAELLSHISEEMHDGFLLFCAELIELCLPDIEILDMMLPNWKMRVVLYVFDYLKSKVTVDDNDNEFVAALKCYIRDGKIHKETLLELKEKMMQFFSEQMKNKGNRNKYFTPDYMNQYLNSKTLRVGHTLEVGPHSILVKQITVDTCEEWLQDYPQEKCDVFMDLCFKVIAAISKDDMHRVHLINPDEDVIMKVSLFLLKKFDNYTAESITLDTNKISLAKREFLNSCRLQRFKIKYTICSNCKGITYNN